MIGAGEMKEENISLEKNDFVIAVDGGYQYCLNFNIHPDLVVSDFDSYPHEIKGIEILRSQPEKDDTDMMLAILAGLERGYDEFVIYIEDENGESFIHQAISSTIDNQQ